MEFSFKFVVCNLKNMYDKLFVFVGDFGLYQLYIFLLLSLPGFFLGYLVFAMTFLGFTPKHFCRIERLKDFPLEAQQRICKIAFISVVF